MEDENVADLMNSLFAARPSSMDEDIKQGEDDEEIKPSDGTRFEPHKYKPIFDGRSNLLNKGTRPIPVLRPNIKEMQNFPAYIESIERKGMHLESGIVKVCFIFKEIFWRLWKSLSVEFLKVKEVFWVL